jgi:hypothetical protein
VRSLSTFLRPLLVALLAALASAATLACARSGAGGDEPFTLVSIEAVERMLTDPGVTVIDANTRDTFEKGHLPRARFYRSAPLGQLLPADKDAAVVFYCAAPS